MSAQPIQPNTSNKVGFVRPNTFTREGGLKIKRHFTREGVHPFDEVEWELRSASITDEKGKVIFEQKDVEVPKAWSQTATNIVVSKYFHGIMGTEHRERSVKQLIRRVADTLFEWGKEMGYFASDGDAEVFHMELTHLLVHQKMAFNSPVWFNVGIEARPQCSACFINSVSDSMESILDLAKTEGMLFKFGSGTGTNFSALRSSREKLSGGGTASGPVSFMKGYDSFAGVIKSGGRTRRAAKMVILDADHPDIVDFIKSKSEEEKKAWALIDAGYEGGFNVPGGAYDSVQFQNANHSVRVSDEFMQAALNDGIWTTKARKDGQPHGHLQGQGTNAHDLGIRLDLRGPGHAVRHHHQPVAHLLQHRPDQLEQSLLRVHVPGRLGLQPGLLEPHEIPDARGGVRHRGFQGTRWTSRSWRRKSRWTTPAIPRNPSSATATITGPWGWATPTWGRS